MIIRFWLISGIVLVGVAWYLVVPLSLAPMQSSPVSAAGEYRQAGLLPAVGEMAMSREIGHGVFEIPEADAAHAAEAAESDGGMPGMDMPEADMPGAEAPGMDMPGMAMGEQAEEPMPPMDMGEQAQEPMQPMDMSEPAEQPMQPMDMGEQAQQPMPPMDMGEQAEEPMPPMDMGEQAEQPMPPMAMGEQAEEPMQPMDMGEQAQEPMQPMDMGEQAQEPMQPMAMGEQAEEPMPPMDMGEQAQEPMQPMAMGEEMEAHGEPADMAMGEGEHRGGRGLRILDPHEAMGHIDREVAISMKEWGFESGNLTVKAGETIRLIVRNTGNIPHEFMIMPADGMQAVNYRLERADWNLLEHEALFEREIVLPGDSFEVVLQVEQPGMWMYMCMFPYHMQFGMMGMMMTEGTSTDGNPSMGGMKM